MIFNASRRIDHRSSGLLYDVSLLDLERVIQYLNSFKEYLFVSISQCQRKLCILALNTYTVDRRGKKLIMDTIFDSADTINMRYSTTFHNSSSIRSPKVGNDGEIMDLTGIFAMKSPLSVLASDMSVNFCIQNEAYIAYSNARKTPRRCLLKDLADAQDEEFETSPVGRISLPAKRQFSRTHTAFGRLQKCSDKDYKNTDIDHELE